jgi:hypothetical protein
VLILKRPWTQQPSFGAQVRRDTSLGASTIGAWGANSSDLKGNAAGPTSRLIATSGDLIGYSSKGAALRFDGANRYDASYSALKGTPFTLMCWARWDGAAGPTNGAVFGVTIGTGLTYVARILIDGSSMWGIQAYASGLNAVAGGTKSVVVGEWVHLAAVYISDNNRELWVNGEYAANDPTFSGVGFTQPTDVFFGWQPWGGGTNFNGQVLAPLIANRALTKSEIIAHRDKPWQLLAPSQIIIPTATAGAGYTHPTLSNARMGSMTGTGGIPQVDYTF